MTLQSLWKESANALREAGCDTALLDARLLLQHVTGFSYEQFLMHAKDTLPAEQAETFDALFQRRKAREPMAYILGRQEFYSRPFRITKDVLTPRPDTETIVDAVLAEVDRAKPHRILDLGTGSGCLLITLLAELPEATGLGVDTSVKALAVAEDNGLQHNVNSRVRWQAGTWCEGLAETFDIVVANPPYIASNAVPELMPEVAKYEPLLALDGGMDGLKCYRDIARGLERCLAADALVVLEVGEGQHEDVSRIFAEQGFAPAGFRNDLAGIPRAVIMRAKRA